MATDSYLVFALDALRFIVPARAVREVVWLPELVPVAQMPDYVPGLLHLRGTVVPVIDLGMRIGYARRPYHLDDRVIVLEYEEAAVGIVAGDVYDVREVDDRRIEPAPEVGPEIDPSARFIAGVVPAAGEVLMLLHLENVVHLPQALDPGAERGERPQAPGAFCPEATPEEREIFRERALSLAEVTDETAEAGRQPLAVIRLGDECFGIEMEAVREFCELRDITPLPCCPAHVLGVTNLRGEILPVIDVRERLGVPASASNGTRTALVSQMGELVAAIVVDAVLDMVSVAQAQIARHPLAPQAGAKPYLRGTVPYREGVLSILDLLLLLSEGGLVVDEEVV